MSTKRYSLEEFRESLTDRRLSVVAKKTKLSSLTVQNIANGKADYISMKTHDKLAAYLFPEAEK